jgi:hypothetical protein
MFYKADVIAPFKMQMKFGGWGQGAIRQNGNTFVRSMTGTAKLARLKQVILDEFCLNTAPGYVSNGETTHPTVTFLNGLKRTPCRVRKQSRLRVQTPLQRPFMGQLTRSQRVRTVVCYALSHNRTQKS